MKSLKTNCIRFKQTNKLRNPDLKQQIDFIGKLYEDNFILYRL